MATLNPEQWQKLSPYLDQALTLTDEERARWLADLRAQDPSLAAQIQALLDDQRAANNEGFLETSPVLPIQGDGSAGEIVGAYRLLSMIGQGGMGMVWLAERSDGRFQRQAAVKFLGMGLASGGAAARFKREGAILGRLSHPHIAELLDAGVTPAGRPYLVLEFVDGAPIHHYCDEHKLDVAARCRLFLDVLSAVAHAHASLIVHRDIKPSNVFVSREGQVKLLDFGIAKLLEGEGSDGSATLLTHEAGSALTPEFAAPEQITSAAVTTATDVYSLGVLLYLLLSGQHPAGPGPHSAAGLVKAIVDTEPPRVSDAAVSSVALASSISAGRGATPEKLRRQLQGDLDTIVAKALKKDPRERYVSVTALADDISRYLRSEPISAHPDTLAYRTAKFVRRNRVTVTLASLALVAVLAGVAGTLLQARTARQQRDLAIRERDRATRISGFMTDMFKQSDPTENAAKDVTAREVLDKASKDIDSGLAKDPELQAQMMHVMGNAYTNLGQYKQAEALMRRAVELSRASAGPSAPQTLNLIDELGGTLAQQGGFAEAEKLQRQALEMQTRVLGPDHPDTLSTMGDLSATLAMSGKLPEAEKLGRETLDKQLLVLGPEDHHTIATMDDLAATLGEEGHFAESVDLERQTIEVERRVFGPDHLGVLMSMGNEADSLYSMGRLAEAQQLLEQTRPIQLRVLGVKHPETARAAYNLGCIAAMNGKRDEAFTFLNEAIEGLSPIRIPDIKGDPAFNSLHADPRFARLVARAKQRGSGDARCPL
jgi:eukaryotic-like serine/threonine-protein kinase